MLDGIHPIFIIPPVILLLVAIVIGFWRFSKHGAKRSLISIVRVIVYGGFALFILFVIWVGMYYAGGGH